MEQPFKVIKNFISQEKADSLAKTFARFANEHEYVSDPQVPDSFFNGYNLPFFIKELCDQREIISKHAGRNLLPTYSFARIYQTGNILEKHIDRPECELSITINLYADIAWPFYVKDEEGTTHELILSAGDAVIYRGCDVEHWRNAYTGQFCSQLFLHYVYEDGQYADKYFDRDNVTEIPAYKKLPPKSNNNPVLTSPPIPEQNQQEPLPERMDLRDYIKCYERVFSKDECRHIIETCLNTPGSEAATVGSGEENKEVRDCSMLDISTKLPELDKLVHANIEKVVHAVCRDFGVQPRSDQGYQFLTYNVGQFYAEHLDVGHDSGSMFRVVSASIWLNSEYEGGEMSFFNGKYTVRCPAGSVLVFPSNYLYPHQILPVTKGVRHSIVTWFM